jgi:7-carboxy-7-deazaguanine synthase
MQIISIFSSIDGEVNAFHAGRQTVFVRTASCNCRCTYCDTEYSFGSGMFLTVDDVVSQIMLFKAKKVTITGGEPLLQLSDVSLLIEKLLDLDYLVSVETNGSFAPPPHLLKKNKVSWVMDYKLASSKMEGLMVISNFTGLSEKDYVKFLIMNETDLKRALEIQHIIKTAVGSPNVNFAYSPVHKVMPPEKLVALLEEHGEGTEVLNLQLHKLIWPGCGQAEER